MIEKIGREWIVLLLFMLYVSLCGETSLHEMLDAMKDFLAKCGMRDLEAIASSYSF